MITPVKVLGTILFTNPDTAMATEMRVCMDPETELLFAVEADWLDSNDRVQSPFAEGTVLKVVDTTAKSRVIPAQSICDDSSETDDDDDNGVIDSDEDDDLEDDFDAFGDDDDDDDGGDGSGDGSRVYSGYKPQNRSVRRKLHSSRSQRSRRSPGPGQDV